MKMRIERRCDNMAGKNNKRYKIRKNMNKIKHEPKRLFNEPPVLISTWEELVGLENDLYRIEVDIDRCSGWVRPKFEMPDKDYTLHNIYLSTHTFYGSNYFNSTVLLRNFGFNIQLKNWDGETVYCTR